MGKRVDSARKEVAKYEAIEAQWTQRDSEIDQELADLEASAGGEMLDASLAGDGIAKASEVAERLARLHAERDAVRYAKAAATDARERREREVLAAQALELRDKEKRARADGATHKQKTDRLLGDLLDHEGVEYVPKPPERPVVTEGLQGGAPVIVRVEVPRSTAMLLEADKLAAGAGRLEARARGEEPGPPPVSQLTGEPMVPAEAV